jgi:hypothetical protein
VAAKNLARTIIESARRGWFRSMQRKYVRMDARGEELPCARSGTWTTPSMRAARTPPRGSGRAKANVDDAIDAGCPHAAAREWKGEGALERFRPMYRFLRSSAGRRWDDVFAELLPRPRPEDCR